MNKIFTTDISKHQARDTGMAVVLVLLLIGVFSQNFDYIKIALVALIFTMAIPMIFKYVAVIWLGFSHILGTIVSKIILTAIFFLVLTPVGLIRKIMGYDTLKLKLFKKNTESVMQVRDISFSGDDIEKPF
jgi:predicted membrane protein